MEDREIIELYFKRNEDAISQTALKYGSFCGKIAMNLLSSKEDSEECVNETYYVAWSSIPPQMPNRFRAWLGKTVRNIALNMWDKNHAKKRYSGITAVLEELEECIPSKQSVESRMEQAEITEVVNSWLMTLDSDDRTFFIRRYWNGTPLNILAKSCRISPEKLAQKMYRLRQSLKKALEREGIAL